MLMLRFVCYTIVTKQKQITAYKNRKENKSMWSRKELKAKGKMAFNRNYWKTVLVSVLISLLFSGGIVGVVYNFGSWGTHAGMVEPDNSVQATVDESSLDDSLDTLLALDEDASLKELQTALNDSMDSIYEGLDIDETTGAVIAVFLVVFCIIFLIVLVIALLIDAFVVYPFGVGMNRFFLVNLNDKAEVKEIGYGYDHNYKNNVKTMFLRGLYTFFWSLLLVIPGIVKSYEYRMIPYLLADDPNMTKDEAFRISREMMRGQKWRAFVLDLSFIGWRILGMWTAGILNIFYVNPYYNMTCAALYESLKNDYLAKA